jgi:hypothetical protein
MNMITGLLFTLAQKPPVAANDRNAEGRHFPPPPTKKIKAPYDVVRLTQIVSVFLTVIGVSLLSVGAATWSFDPAHGLNIQTAVLSFTLPVGVFS